MPAVSEMPARTAAPAIDPAAPPRHDWSRAEVLALLELPFNDLLHRAASVHRAHFDPAEVQVSTLLSVKTGGCPEDCGYCPQAARYHTGVDATKLMSTDAVVEKARQAKAAGASRFCMGAAWRSPKDRDIPKVAAMIAEVKALGLETCATLGMLSGDQARALKDAGLDYYNHNLDTAPEFYGEVIHTREYQDRLDTLAHVRDTGMKTCCGGIVGMGESRGQRAGLLQTLATLPAHPDSVPINRLVQVAGTPLEGTAELDPFEFVRTIDFGIINRATAMVRTNSNGSSSAVPSSGVPATCTSRLIGTEPGCSGRLARVCSRPARCARDSPMPTMPPQQVFIPASRTWPSVSRRSWYSRVWITSP